VTGFTLEGLLGRRGKLRSVGESESHFAREKMLQDELYLLCRHPLSAIVEELLPNERFSGSFFIFLNR